ncbi:MAG: Re/Si-specific NAD(P)(+) transhydrogenase subunit alpha [Rhodothermales bacterium]
MALTIGVPKETAAGEYRVALVPEVVARLKRDGLDVVVESGAGEAAHHADAAYEEKGARIGDRAAAFGADVVAKVQPPTDEEIALLSAGTVLIGFLSPLNQPEISEKLAARGVTALSMELVPRISRAQKMDALSAMASLGGYKAVLVAATSLPKFFPLLTTAAGTIRPANVLILGAGVAGLQAIATARRLGARVAAYDIREAVREEVQSLGGTFVELELEIADMQDAGGYAKALVEEKARRQTELLVPHIAKADVVITTALIPGRRAPILVTREAVEEMASGAIIIDMAAPNGGNCALTTPGETVVHNGVQILGPLNLPATMPVHSSQLYARTVMAMIQEFAGEEGFATDFEDDIFKGACVTHGGAVVHERVKSLLTA